MNPDHKIKNDYERHIYLHMINGHIYFGHQGTWLDRIGGRVLFPFRNKNCQFIRDKVFDLKAWEASLDETGNYWVVKRHGLDVGWFKLTDEQKHLRTLITLEES